MHVRPATHASEKPRHDGEPSRWSMDARNQQSRARLSSSGRVLRAPPSLPGLVDGDAKNEHIEKLDDYRLKFLILKHTEGSRVGRWRIRLLPRRRWSWREAIVR